MNKDNEKKALINLFVKESFRDVADRDYISARLSYKYGLLEQFLWSSLQALEKYLKAVLLFHRIDTNSIGHNIKVAYNKVLQLPGVIFPVWIESYIDYLNKYATPDDRYLCKPNIVDGEALIKLDKTVWITRSYCLPQDQLDKIKQKQRDFYLKNPEKFRIFGGFLEKVLKNKEKELYSILIWKNPCYGKNKKNKIKNYKFKSGSRNPVHFRHPEIFPCLSRLVRFSASIKRAFND